jgi:hypothetical protein
VNESPFENGGVCRTGGSPSVYLKAGDTLCTDEDLITYEEDCEEAYSERRLYDYL